MSVVDKPIISIPKAYLSEGQIMVETGPNRAVNLVAAEKIGLVTAQDAKLLRGLLEAQRLNT